MPDSFQYFNYFTEIEEHFQRTRGTSLFLLSPLDWALIETWKNNNVPLEAVLRGIDAAFEKWRSRKVKTQAVNSLAYCAQAVLTAAQRFAPEAVSKTTSAPAFSEEEVRLHLQTNIDRIRGLRLPQLEDLADALQNLLPELAALTRDFLDFEELEQRLTALEGKLISNLRSRQSDDDAVALRQELDGYLRPYRSKMTAPQLSMLETQYLERQTLERAGLARLSLFHLR